MRDKLQKIISVTGTTLLIFSPAIVLFIIELIKDPDGTIDDLISFGIFIFNVLAIIVFIFFLKWCVKKLIELCCKDERTEYIVPISSVTIFVFVCIIVAKIFPANMADSGTNLPIAKIIVAVIFIVSIVYIMNYLPPEPDRKEKPKKKCNQLPPAQNGYEYEARVAHWLRDNEFKYVNVTPSSGDFGVDITAYKDGIKYAIQCKFYTGKVGVSAVHEVAGGMAHYGCDIGMVVTNSTFTDSARTLARENGIILKERIML